MNKNIKPMNFKVGFIFLSDDDKFCLGNNTTIKMWYLFVVEIISDFTKENYLFYQSYKKFTKKVI